MASIAPFQNPCNARKGKAAYALSSGNQCNVAGSVRGHCLHVHERTTPCDDIHIPREKACGEWGLSVLSWICFHVVLCAGNRCFGALDGLPCKTDAEGRRRWIVLYIYILSYTRALCPSLANGLNVSWREYVLVNGAQPAKVGTLVLS